MAIDTGAQVIRDIENQLAEVYTQLKIVFQTQSELSKSFYAILEAAKDLDEKFEGTYLKHFSDQVPTSLDQALGIQLAMIDRTIQRLRS